MQEPFVILTEEEWDAGPIDAVVKAEAVAPVRPAAPVVIMRTPWPR